MIGTVTASRMRIAILPTGTFIRGGIDRATGKLGRELPSSHKVFLHQDVPCHAATLLEFNVYLRAPLVHFIPLQSIATDKCAVKQHRCYKAVVGGSCLVRLTCGPP